MKISELVERLNKAKGVCGDIQIVFALTPDDAKNDCGIEFCLEECFGNDPDNSGDIGECENGEPCLMANLTPEHLPYERWPVWPNPFGE